jgi:hypothetical protein
LVQSRGTISYFNPSTGDLIFQHPFEEEKLPDDVVVPVDDIPTPPPKYKIIEDKEKRQAVVEAFKVNFKYVK